jgi:Zn-dependent protease
LTTFEKHFMDWQSTLQTLLITLPMFLLSLSVHEAAHAKMADVLGDPTARHLGRVTLNPVPHIDIIGTIILPIMSIVSGGFLFIGWAKPVPVDWRNLYNIRRDDTLIALAGPASNVVLSFILFVAMAAVALAGMDTQQGSMGEVLLRLFRYGMLINLSLAVFNMLPVPPLDGSHVVANALPDDLSEKYRSIGIYGIFILLILINFTPLGKILSMMIGGIYQAYMSLLSLML